MDQLRLRFALTLLIVVIGTTKLTCQAPVQEILSKGTISDQMKYVQDKTLIYEGFRAIREDMFQLLKNNAIDSLMKARNDINGLLNLTGRLNSKIDSLKNNLNASEEQVKNLTTTKNSISVLGIELNKTSYNSLMWMIVAVLAVLLGIGFLAFKRNVIVTLGTKKELTELKAEFEAYRQKTRIEREKVSMEHFNEIRKLKGK